MTFTTNYGILIYRGRGKGKQQTPNRFSQLNHNTKGQVMKMKRNFYWVISYDGKIEKMYKNYKSAYKYAEKLIRQDIYNGIYTYNENGKLEQIIGC